MHPIIHRPAWVAAFAIAALLPVLAVLPPFVSDPLRVGIMLVFSPLCHQIPERSFHLHGASLAVCHRCLGIYLGMAGAIGVFPLFAGVARRLVHWDRLILAGALGMAGVDWAAGMLDIWHSPPLGQAATGAVFGAVAGVLIARAVAGEGKATIGPSRDVSRENGLAGG